MLATLPNELLLMLRPYMSLSSINALSQTSNFFRNLFDEEFLKAACYRRKLSRPLAEQGNDNAKERVPDYRTLVASMCAHLKTCKVKKCHAFLKFPVGNEEVKPSLTPEMIAKPGVKLALHKVLNQLSMVSYFNYRDAGLYLEKEDLLPSKKGQSQIKDDDLQDERLVNHLPLASFHCSAPAMTTFEYADEYGPFGWKLENNEGVTLLDCVQTLIMGIGYTMKENWKMMKMDGQIEGLMENFEGEEEDLEMLMFALSDKLDKEWEADEDYLRLGVADEFMGDHKFFCGFYARGGKGGLKFGVNFE